MKLQRDAEDPQNETSVQFDFISFRARDLRHPDPVHCGPITDHGEQLQPSYVEESYYSYEFQSSNLGLFLRIDAPKLRG